MEARRGSYFNLVVLGISIEPVDIAKTVIDISLNMVIGLFKISTITKYATLYTLEKNNHHKTHVLTLQKLLSQECYTGIKGKGKR